MEKEFIPYEQALDLKELGFDELCLDKYDPRFEKLSSNMETWSNEHYPETLMISAPLYQQAFRWFREKQGLHCIYTMGDDWNNYYWQVWRNDTMTKTYVCSSDWVYETYEEAELACLNKLIRIVKKYYDNGRTL